MPGATINNVSQLRIDRWLFFCRFYKTRVLAAAAVSGGHVSINGHKASPSNKVSCGDTVELTRERMPYAMTVCGIPSRRGPANEARLSYAEDEAVTQQRARLLTELKIDRSQMPTTDGRPDKHTRRLLRDRNRNRHSGEN